jgi:signal transduction histidine kinase
MLAGLVAPAANEALLFVTISVYASILFLSRGAPPDRMDEYRSANEQIGRFASTVIGHLGLPLYVLFTFIAACWATRRVSQAHARHACIVGAAACASQFALAAAFAGLPELLASLASFLAITCAAAACGGAVGWAVGEPTNVLSRVKLALRSARTPAEVAARIASTRGVGSRATVRLWPHGSRAVLPIAQADPDRDRRAEHEETVPTANDLRLRNGLVVHRRHGSPPSATLWALLPTEGGVAGVLEVTSERPWLYLRLRRPMWRAIAQLVGRVLDDLSTLETVRQAALRAERERIGRDIHDTLAQDVLSAVVHLEAAGLVECAPSPARRHLDLALTSARDALSTARQVVWATRPRAIDDVPLHDALSSLVGRWCERTTTTAKVACHGVAHPLGRGVEEALLRVAQEALHNVRKHADANEVVVTLSYMGSAVALDVRDDGRGFRTSRSQQEGGFGLLSMREQVRSIGGDFTVETRRGAGTTIAVMVPVPGHREAAS